ncbi:MAG: nucleoside triphosphate pyrophosphohydrolase [Bacteroidales bacterium]|jgi:XTP/dITP diphosphohydrolase|nr:nucleoside triphosphate pyrophosphohydrolase [Bacteroidales bacterium]MDY0313936.1 nucleoside triphosphate pyrophosphohydrolase [Bacteroidales bacterium]NLB86412.1 nucleoside triphosphate pyrophosphohydrolase [Bacteroidales bacterium]
MDKRLTEFKKLLDIMDELRIKCPWDSTQTNESLKTLSIEEVYELADAISKENDDEIKKELGDILLHIVFYAKIGQEKGSFDIYDVIKSINDKLEFRHPHIFGDVKLATAKEVEENWERIKLKEGKKKTVLGGVPNALPAMIKAHRIQDKARGVGFDWEEKEQVWDKVKEEYLEMIDELKNNNTEKFEQEFGDFMFSIINAARLYNINPENALEKTNKKFITRFNYLEQKTIAQGKDLKNMTLDEMNEIWEESKAIK